MSPDDERFVRASWFESYWMDYQRERGIAFADYKAGQNRRIETLLERSEVLVAFAPAAPDEILGYAVIEGEALHYTYVKSIYRRRGIATGLIRSRAKTYSVKTPGMKKLLAKVPLQFNPYTIEDAVPEELA
jgi:GNAT superfamily N-acetyltransferase